MSVDVRPEVRIRRPRHEVADFMFDPGTTFGRPVASPTAARPSRGRWSRGQRAANRTLPRAQLADAADGATVTAIRATGEPARFLGWATPLLRRQVRRSISADLERLRVVLEN